MVSNSEESEEVLLLLGMYESIQTILLKLMIYCKLSRE